MSAEKRLGKELVKIQKKPIPNCTVKLEKDDNLLVWLTTVAGPKGTPYEGGIFKFKLTFPKEYPFHPPTVKSMQKVYHPSFDGEGNVCIDITRKEVWSPMCGVQEILMSFEELLRDPNTDHPLNETIAEVYKNKRSEFNKTAKEWTKKYATGK